MLRFSEVSDFVKAGLTAKGYGVGTGPRMPVIFAGPPAIQALYKQAPNGLILLTVGNGTGWQQEGLYDTPFITARIMGGQRDYEYAETLAFDLDAILMAVGETQPEQMGATRVLYVTRNAPPQLVDYDGADRYHFQTTYIAEAQR